jgi:hypothetical protein
MLVLEYACLNDALINAGIFTLEIGESIYPANFLLILYQTMTTNLPNSSHQKQLKEICETKEPSKAQYQIQTALRTVILSIMRKNTINNTLSKNC